jgi:tRNA threonylcarbamoyladenosine biosynthesis protein TsaE
MQETSSEKVIIPNLKDFENWAKKFTDSLVQQKGATIICLSGDVGVGKTTLTQFVARFLKIENPITSPTFVIQKEYDISNHAWIKKLIHIDAYRLGKKEDLEYLGWQEIIANPEHLIVVEWPEIVEGITMPDPIHIHLEIQDDRARILTKKQS